MSDDDGDDATQAQTTLSLRLHSRTRSAVAVVLSGHQAEDWEDWERRFQNAASSSQPVSFWLKSGTDTTDCSRNSTKVSVQEQEMCVDTKPFRWNLLPPSPSPLLANTTPTMLNTIITVVASFQHLTTKQWSPTILMLNSRLPAVP